MKKMLLLLFLFSSFEYLNAENGYDLWLRYKTIDNKQLLHLYRQQITGLTIHGSSPTITAAKEELSLGLQGLLQIKIPFTSGTHQKGTVLAGTPSSSPSIRQLGLTSYLRQTGSEGFIIMTKKINGR